MSDTRRWWLCVAVACGSIGLLPGTHSWLVFTARPFLVLCALCALAPWSSDGP